MGQTWNKAYNYEEVILFLSFFLTVDQKTKGKEEMKWPTPGDRTMREILSRWFTLRAKWREKRRTDVPHKLQGSTQRIRKGK